MTWVARLALFTPNCCDFGVHWKPFSSEESAWHLGACLASFYSLKVNAKLMQKMKILSFQIVRNGGSA